MLKHEEELVQNGQGYEEPGPWGLQKVTEMVLWSFTKYNIMEMDGNNNIMDMDGNTNIIFQYIYYGHRNIILVMMEYFLYSTI